MFQIVESFQNWRGERQVKKAEKALAKEVKAAVKDIQSGEMDQVSVPLKALLHRVHLVYFINEDASSRIKEKLLEKESLKGLFTFLEGEGICWDVQTSYSSRHNPTGPSCGGTPEVFHSKAYVVLTHKSLKLAEDVS